jgi:hypothetical protein
MMVGTEMINNTYSLGSNEGGRPSTIKETPHHAAQSGDQEFDFGYMYPTSDVNKVARGMW